MYVCATKQYILQNKAIVCVWLYETMAFKDIQYSLCVRETCDSVYQLGRVLELWPNCTLYTAVYHRTIHSIELWNPV